MLNLRNLMDFLPYYYREADTYKVSGKGILERYLEIFGNYFEDYIIADTKNILDILDIDNCPEIYLNYLWEFLGQMPFAYGCNIDAEKWSMYFNGFDSDEKITELSHLWIIPKDSNDNFNLSPDQVRKFLKYSISLFKIRGTQRFFEILFKMYGLTCEIGLPQSDSFMDPTGNTSSDYYGSDDDYAGSDNEEDNDDEDYGGRDLYVSRYVSTKLDIEDNCLDECTLDKRSTCTKCITLPVTITGHSFDSEDIYEENFVQFQKICEAIFDRFLPYNVQADINYGFIIPCTYHIATYLKEGDQWLFLKSDTSKNVTNLAKLYLQDNIIRELQIKVLVSRTYRNRDDLKFRVGSITQVEPGETPQIKTLSETEHISTDIIHITRSLDGSDYLLYSSEPNSDGTHTQVNLSVIRKVVVKEYTLEAHTVQGTFILSPEHPYLQLNVTSSVSIDNHPYPVRYRDLDTGEIHNSGTGFIISSPKLYRFGLVDFPLKQIEVNITRVPEKLSIICTPVSNTLNLPNEIVKTHVIVEGDYDNVEFDRTAIVIQAMTSGGNIIDNLALENYYIVSGESPNVVASTICGHGSIPILDNDHATEVIEPIEAIRICHLKNIIRNTSQSLVIHTRKVVGGTVTHQYTNLLSQITYHKGRISSSTTPPSPVSDSDYVYSDWIPVSEYQEGFTSESTPKPINCLEYHLLCSKFKYYEISNRSIQYNSGEYFETSSPGSFIFRPLLESDFEIDPEYSQASYVVNSNVDSDVQYGINVNPSELTYQDVMGQTYTKAVNAVITVSTNLEFAEGLRRDSLNPLNFKVYIYSRADWEDSTPGHVPTYKKVIYPNDSGWVVNTQSSKYEKYISVMFTDGSGDDSDFPAQGIISDGKYVLVLDPNSIMSGYTKSKTILLLNYVDPNRDYIALVPYIASDPGWSNKDWSKDNTYATWYPNLAYQNSNYLSVRIQGSDGSLSGYGTVNVYQVIDSVETLVQTFEVGTRPSSINNNTAGLYRFRVNNGTSDSTLYAQLIISNMNITYSIECSPSSAYQSDFSTIKVSVYGKVNNFSAVPPENLYVRRVGENIWYPSGHLFLIVAPGTDTTYTFQLKGDPSQTCTFTYLVAPPQT